jgi:hypothetical protein
VRSECKAFIERALPALVKVFTHAPENLYFGSMRKWIALLLVLFAIVVVPVYLLIPTTLSVNRTTRIGVNATAFTRVFLHQGNGHAWFAGKNANDSTNCFVYNGKTYSLLERKFASLVYAVGGKKDSLLAELVVIPFRADSVELHFIGVAKAGFNPLARIQKYFWTKQEAKDLQSLLQEIHDYYIDNANIYGFHINKDYVADSLLISTSTTLKTPPATNDVYSLIDKLKAHAAKKGAKITGLPMLNVTANADSTYLTRVALPVDRRLTNEGEITFRWMMGEGNILITDVKGGPAKIEKAFSATRTYATDNGYATAAIPFQSLVTDRRQEPDTNKWITKVYWPVR